MLRALAWGIKAPASLDGKGDGAFGLSAQLALANGRAVARTIVGDLMGRPLAGEAEWRWQGRPELSLRLEAPQIDVRALAPVEASLGDAVNFLLNGPPAEGTGPNTASGGRAEAGQPDLRLRLEAGRLITATRTYRDVALNLRLKGGNLELPLLRMADERGVAVDLKGQLENVASRPKGSLSGVVALATAADVGDLARLLGVPEALRPDPRLAGKLAPLRLAGTLLFGGRTATSRDLTLAGDVNGTTLKLTGRLDGAAGGWRAGPAEIVATMDAPDARKLVALLSETAAGGADKAAPGQAFFKAKGVPAEGLSSVLSLAAGDLSLDFQGRVSALEHDHKIAADLRLKAADGGRLAALAGLSPPLPLAGVAIEGSLALGLEPGAVTLEHLLIKAAGHEVRGRIAMRGSAERRQLDARLQLSELSVRSLLAPVLDLRLAAITGAAEAALAGGALRSERLGRRRGPRGAGAGTPHPERRPGTQGCQRRSQP